ncbi:MAG: tetratricopeptide repeat protein, partial [Bacteroidales bacterium]
MVIIVCFYGNIKAQESSVRTFRQSAIETYNRGQYEKAFRQFSELLSMFPRDPLYKYYAGVCLVKLEREPATAASFLKEASEGSGTIKPVPSDVWFWRGRAQHLAGMFSEAVASYERFTELAGKKSAREMNVPEYIRQCNERKGNITGFISQGKVIPFNNELIAKDTEKQPVDDTA